MVDSPATRASNRFIGLPLAVVATIVLPATLIFAGMILDRERVPEALAEALVGKGAGPEGGPGLVLEAGRASYAETAISPAPQAELRLQASNPDE
jgi:hypothetical protein